jgi:hypothetical protein
LVGAVAWPGPSQVKEVAVPRPCASLNCSWKPTALTVISVRLPSARWNADWSAAATACGVLAPTRPTFDTVTPPNVPLNVSNPPPLPRPSIVTCPEDGTAGVAGVEVPP